MKALVRNVNSRFSGGSCSPGRKLRDDVVPTARPTFKAGKLRPLPAHIGALQQKWIYGVMSLRRGGCLGMSYLQSGFKRSSAHGTVAYLAADYLDFYRYGVGAHNSRYSSAASFRLSDIAASRCLQASSCRPSRYSDLDMW